MKNLYILHLGPGRVGKEVMEQMNQVENNLLNQYATRLIYCGIFNSHAGVFNKKGFSLCQALEVRNRLNIPSTVQFVKQSISEIPQPFVLIDTTGSVIYTGDSILKMLTEATSIICLETPQSVQDKMFKLYMQDPKPVIWNDAFTRKKGESDHDALARCYPTLLQTRSQKYKKLAHKTLNYHKYRSSSYTMTDFLAAIETV